jgi:hypothetical protein
MKRCAICGVDTTLATCPQCGEASWLPANEPASNPENYSAVELECDRVASDVVTSAVADIATPKKKRGKRRSK